MMPAELASCQKITMPCRQGCQWWVGLICMAKVSNGAIAPCSTARLTSLRRTQPDRRMKGAGYEAATCSALTARWGLPILYRHDRQRRREERAAADQIKRWQVDAMRGNGSGRHDGALEREKGSAMACVRLRRPFAGERGY